MSATYVLTWLDLLVAAIFLSFILRGAWTGFMRQLAALLALAGSYVVAAQYTAELIPYTRRFIDNPKLVFLISFICLFFAAALAFSLLADSGGSREWIARVANKPGWLALCLAAAGCGWGA